MTYIIAFEGLDCSFKETNARNLVLGLENKLSEKYGDAFDFEFVSFPRYRSLAAYHVSNYLHDEFSDFFDTPIVNETEYSKRLELVTNFYGMDMFDWYYNKYRKNRDMLRRHTNRVVVMDRWFYSMMYYLIPDINNHFKENIVKRMAYANFVYSKFKSVFKLPDADIVFKMNNSIDTIVDIIQKMYFDGIKNSDIYEEDVEYLKIVKDNFDNLDFKSYIDTNNLGFKFKAVIDIDVGGKGEIELADEIRNCEAIDDIIIPK